jgi:ABC-2 type transport system permease protein
MTERVVTGTPGWSIPMAFVERQTNLWKRYWAWELVWLVYGVVNTLAVTLIAEQLGQQGAADAAVAQELVLFLLIGTLVWAYLSAVLDDIGLVVGWERWEGTIEHTLMAPVPRSLHLLGMCGFAVAHGMLRTLLIFGIALLFFDVDFSNADWLSATSVLLVGSVSVAGLAVFSFLSPATYILDGIRGALIDGDSLGDVAGILGALVIFAAVLVPMSFAVFVWAEGYAKRTGKLKRQG